MSELSELEAQGLALQAVLDVAALPSELYDLCVDAGADLREFRRIVLLGQAGRRLWETIEAAGGTGEHRFDETSTTIVERWLVRHHPRASWQLLYPSDMLVPLGRLGTHAGWGAPSPLGLGIHPTWGLWQAHRVAFAIDADLAPTPLTVPPHACATCVDRPCVTACPVGAVSMDAPFDVATCGANRLTDGSECAHQCLARNACPVGAEHRYGDAQMAYHYAASLPALRRWLSG